MKSPIHQDTRIAAFAEGQMRTWGRLQETASRAANRQKPGPSLARAVEFVAVSREAGADGAAIARMVGERLGWKVYDGNLLDQVAQRYKESRLMLDLVNETESNWVYDVLGTWMDRQIIPHEKYAVQVGRLIQAVARNGSAVFVGRGAQFVLPRPQTFAVRVVAPEAFAPSACGSGVRSPCRKPWSGFAAPTAVAASSSSDSSTRISTIRTSTIWSSTPNALVWLGPPTRSCMRCIARRSLLPEGTIVG